MKLIRSGPFARIPRNHYRTILADPPWRFKAGEGNRTAPYPTMELADMKALPVSDIAAPAAVLFMWTSGPFLPHALALGEAWGFDYVTKAFNWTKLWPREGNRLFVDWQEIANLSADQNVSKGSGYWTRAGCEDVLLFKRGDVDWAPGNPASDRARDVAQVVISERREHSRKPETVQDGIERISHGPFMELFSRRLRPGWRTWGNQTEHFPAVTVESGRAT